MSKTINLSVLVCVSAFCIFVGCGKSQKEKNEESNCESALRLYTISLSNMFITNWLENRANPYIIKENTNRVPSFPANEDSNKSEFGLSFRMNKNCEFVFDKKVIGKNVKELSADTVVVYCKKHKHNKILAKEFQN